MRGKYTGKKTTVTTTTLNYYIQKIQQRYHKKLHTPITTKKNTTTQVHNIEHKNQCLPQAQLHYCTIHQRGWVLRGGPPI